MRCKFYTWMLVSSCHISCASCKQACIFTILQEIPDHFFYLFLNRFINFITKMHINFIFSKYTLKFVNSFLSPASTQFPLIMMSFSFIQLFKSKRLFLFWFFKLIGSVMSDATFNPCRTTIIAAAILKYGGLQVLILNQS